MKLFYLPGSCALGPHIALEYSGLTYEAARVERGKQTDPAYLAINPLGRVPALVTATHGTITEAPVVLSYIADLATGRGLLPAIGTTAAAQLANDFAYIDRHLSNRRWVAGDHLTAADFHLFVFGRWGLRLTTSTRNFPCFHRHTLQIASLSATQSAIAQEGVTLEGPAAGAG